MRKRGLFSLIQDCDDYRPAKKAILKYRNSKDEEIILTKADKKEQPAEKKTPLDTAAEFYDFGEAVSLSFGSQAAYAEAKQHARQNNNDDPFSDELAYEVESFEQAETTNKGAVGKDVEEAIVVNDPKPAPLPVTTPPAERMPITTDEVKENTLPLTADDHFEADLKAILAGQKKYDQEQKKTIATQAEGGPKRAKRRPLAEAEEPFKDEHAIFDKIAQSMQLATAYDLGSINLEQRFDAFDEELEKQEVASKKKTAELEQTTLPEAQSQEVDTTDFLADLDKMSGQSSYSGAFSNDIPLSPQSGGRSIGQDALEVGDIILSTTDDPEISGNIRKITRSEISHAAIYVGDGHVIEAIESGVLQRSLDTAMADDSVTVAFRHQYMTPEKAEIIKNFLIEKRKAKTGFDRYAVIRNLPIQVITSACAVLAPELRDKCRNFAGRIFLGTETNNEFYCSELVFAAFEAAGLQLANTSPQWTSAEDLVQLSYNGTLRYVGHLKTT